MRFKSVFNHLFIHVCSMHIQLYQHIKHVLYYKTQKVLCHLNIKHYIETIRQKLVVFAVELSLLREKK